MPLPNLQAHLDSALKRHRVAGASVAVYHQGELQTACGGVANSVTGIAITPDTLMHIGSITKLFTTTLVLQLVDKGLLSLDDLVIEHVPALTIRDTKALQKITVRMLLNHTSGIDGDVQPDHGHDQETLEKAITRFARIGQIHAPGADFSYCNGGFVIAGYLAQQLTGKSWYQLIHEYIYQPLGMHHAITLPEEALLHRVSAGHFLEPDSGSHIRTSVSLLPLSFAPGGTTLMMTAADLVTFARCHLANGQAPNGNNILSVQSAKTMRQQTVNCDKSGFADTMGLAWMGFQNGFLGHGGGAPGVISKLCIHPEQDFAAAVLTNSEHGSVLINELLTEWVGALTGESSPFGSVEPVVTQQQAEDVSGVIGVYENILSCFEVVALQDGLGIKSHFKFPLYDSSVTEPRLLGRLLPVGRDNFIVDTSGIPQGLMIPAARPPAFSFKHQDNRGRMQYLAASDGRLYRRRESLKGDQTP